jgi:glycosyltransferase involved in cell wall biosynthesis
VKILHLVHQYPPSYVGGTELYTQTLAKALAERGHGVTVLHRGSAPGSGLKRRQENGLLILEAWAGVCRPSGRFLATFGHSWLQRTFERVLDEVHPDLVHIQHLMGFPAGCVRSLQRRGIPFVITLHDYWWVCANAQLLTNYSQQLCDGPRAYLNCARCVLARAGLNALWPVLPALAPLLAWRGRTLQSAMLQAAALIAPSSFVQEWYASRGVPVDQITVLPHGLQWPAGLPSRGSVGDTLRLAYVGGLSWQKGVHILVEAVGTLGQAVRLDVAGDESFDPGYAAFLRSKAAPSVHFLGRLGRPEVWGLLSQVDVVAVPSLWRETYSLIAHEAFAAGVPVIASRLGALAGTVMDGTNGLLLPPGDVYAWRGGIQRLMEQPDLLARLRAKVRPPLTLAEHVARVESVYRGSVQGHRRG